MTTPTDPLVRRLADAQASGDHDACLAVLEQLTARDPESPRWPYVLGVTLQERGDVEGAMAAYRRAVTRDPRWEPAWVNLGRLLDDDQCWDEALACYERALALPDGQNDPIAWTNRGNTLMSLGRLEDALASYERAHDLEPDRPIRGLQTVLGWLGRVEEANAARPVGTPQDRGELRQLVHPVGARRAVVRYWTGRHTRPDQLDFVARELLAFVASRVDVPPGIDDGVRIQWGWSPLQVRARGDDLVLCEPDYAEDPMRSWCWDVSFTLQTSLMHAWLDELTGLAPTSCTFHDQVAVVPGSLPLPAVRMRRLHETDDEGFSGWVVGPDDEAAFDAAVASGSAVRMPMGRLATLRHPLIKVALLPAGCTVRFEAHAVVSVRDADGRERFAD